MLEQKGEPMDRNKAKSILEACQYELSNQTGSKQCRKKYEAIQEAIKALEQPEIIHCGECAFPYIRGKNMYCGHITGEEIMVWKDEYCSWAERRTDENN